MNNDTIRMLAASGPLIQPNFPSTLPRPPMMPPTMAAAAAGMDQANQFNRALQAQAQMLAMCQNMPPEELMAHLPRDFMMPPGPYNPYFFDHKRKNASRETTQPLKCWLNEHRKNPYPSKPEKVMLAMITQMSLTQVSTWFANARRRLKKENKMTWSPRNGRGDDSDADDEATDLDTSSNLSIKPEMMKSEGIKAEDLDSPKKAGKIWSIADTINPRADSAASNVSSTSKSSQAVDEKPSLPTTSAASLLGLPNPANPGGPSPNGFNPMLMASMAAANRLSMPPQIYAAFMQQQQAAQAQQAAALQQQQQIAAMLRNAGNFPPMFLNNLFMAGMPGIANLPQASTSTSSQPSSPSLNDPGNTSVLDCDTTATTSSSNQANTSGSTATSTSDDGASVSPSLPLDLKPALSGVASIKASPSTSPLLSDSLKTELKHSP